MFNIGTLSASWKGPLSKAAIWTPLFPTRFKLESLAQFLVYQSLGCHQTPFKLAEAAENHGDLFVCLFNTWTADHLGMQIPNN